MFMNRDFYEVYTKLWPSMLTKTGILALVPDIQPRNARKVIEAAYQRGSSLQLDEDTMEWRCDLSNSYVSPLLAGVIVRLFDLGEIPQAKKSSSKNIDELRAYAATAPTFLEAAAEARRQREAYLERVEEVAGDPGLGRAEEITRAFIDDVLIKRNGLGPGGMIEIDGVKCHKVRRGGRSSNSGKTRDPVYYDIYWIDRDGVRHGDADSEEFLNRRNDPSRNWGLGRD